MKTKTIKVKTSIKAGQGLGDAVAEIAHTLGLDKLTMTFEELTGENCGCKDRQKILNDLVPKI